LEEHLNKIIKMEIYDISILKRDPNQNDLYDLIEQTFTLNTIPLFKFIVGREEEMRPDLISYKLYKSVNYVDFILNLNEIDNPLNIKEGDVILYTTADKFESYKVSPNTIADKRKTLLSPNKSSRKDPNRQQYIEDNYQLPPTFLETPASPISTSGNKITISPIK